jgi:excisionase family DNA binding protein
MTGPQTVYPPTARLTLIEAAAYIGTSPLVLSRHGREGRVARYKLGKSVLFQVSDLDQYLADHRQEATR